jgi:metal-responsive CopG/Arc/MetJ family transcriptional regulator
MMVILSVLLSGGTAMPKAKVAICLEASLLAELDRYAQTEHVSRSALVAAAVEEKVRRLRGEQLRQAYDAVYADGLDDEERAIVEQMIPVAREQLQDEW